MNRNIRILPCILLLAAIFYSCKKESTVEKGLYIRGRLFMDDNMILQQVGVPLGKKKILLADASSSDTLNYLYSDSTDKDGYFIFKLLDSKEMNYVVRYSDSIGGYKYYGTAKGKNGQDDLVVTAMLVNRDLVAKRIVSTDSTGGTIAGAQVIFYSSQALATSDDPTTAVLSGTADTYGTYNIYQLREGDYFVNSKKTISATLYKKIAQKVTVKKGPLTTDTLVLKP